MHRVTGEVGSLVIVEARRGAVGANADVVTSAWESMRRQDLDAVTANLGEEAEETVLPRSLPWGRDLPRA